jgi:hypothetical protein
MLSGAAFRGFLAHGVQEIWPAVFRHAAFDIKMFQPLGRMRRNLGKLTFSSYSHKFGVATSELVIDGDVINPPKMASAAKSGLKTRLNMPPSTFHPFVQP